VGWRYLFIVEVIDYSWSQTESSIEYLATKSLLGPSRKLTSPNRSEMHEKNGPKRSKAEPEMA